jgi:hypothetical protein
MTTVTPPRPDITSGRSGRFARRVSAVRDRLVPPAPGPPAPQVLDALSGADSWDAYRAGKSTRWWR